MKELFSFQPLHLFNSTEAMTHSKYTLIDIKVDLKLCRWSICSRSTILAPVLFQSQQELGPCRQKMFMTSYISAHWCWYCPVYTNSHSVPNFTFGCCQVSPRLVSPSEPAREPQAGTATVALPSAAQVPPRAGSEGSAPVPVPQLRSSPRRPGGSRGNGAATPSRVKGAGVPERLLSREHAAMMEQHNPLAEERLFK